MTHPDRRIVRGATLALVGWLAVSLLGGCIAYGYREPDGGYRNGPDRYPQHGDNGGYADHEQSRWNN